MSVRELDARESGGVRVTLNWNRRDGSLWVVCQDRADSKNDRTIWVRDPANARQVFLHPYAYAMEFSNDRLPVR